MKPVVLVHGAWHGPWCWERVTPALDAAGVPWVAADLPSCARANEGAGVIEDVAEVERILDALDGDEPAILCGHSRAGLVLSEAGTHHRVDELVYLTAFLIEPHEDIAEIVADTVMPIIEFGENFVGVANADAGPAIFYNDCTPDDAAWALARLRPMFLGGAPVEPPRRAWESKPSTYAVCTLDAAILVDQQRQMAKRATTTVEWETGHSPFLNHPELVADLLIDLAGRS